MRIAFALDHARDPLPQLDLVADLERAGLDAVLVPETWGYDAATVTGAIAARTSRVAIGAGVIPVHTRTPALVAQSAATLDALSGGRAFLGLGTSGPGVIEGWHGVPFDRPLGRLRETIAVCRAVWTREPLVHEGPVQPVPLPVPPGAPPARPLRILMRPPRTRIPIVLAAMRPASVALAAEMAEGWYPLFVVPEAVERVWGDALARGRAVRDPSLPPLEIVARFPCAIGPEEAVAPLRESARTEIALYVGGMGGRGTNFYMEVVSALGWARAARAIQERFLAGRRREAAEAIPDDLLRALTLCGPEAAVAERLAALRDAGVGTLVARPLGDDAVGLVARLRDLADRLP